MDGEDSPRRVRCPWRAHPPASTLPAMRGITSTTWSVGRYSWPSCSSNGQSGHHPRPSRPDLALSSENPCARRAHRVEGGGGAEACSSAPQAACLTTLVTIRPLLGVSDPWHQISNLGPRKALKFGELQPSGRRGWWRSDALAGRHGGWSRLSAWFSKFRRSWERARRPGERHVRATAALPRTSARALLRRCPNIIFVKRAGSCPALYSAPQPYPSEILNENNS